MRIQIQKLIVAALLVAILLPFPVFGTAVQEINAAPTETAVPTEALPEDTTPTEPAETLPETTIPAIRTIDSDSAVYQVCDALARDMEARQIFVYDTNTDTILYSKSVESGKLFPASTTKLFSTHVALQYLDPDTVITAGDELELVHEGSSLAYVPVGAQVRVQTLVEGMMLPSGNDAAMILAAAAGRVIAQDENLSAADAVQEFVNEMNHQADLLGFENTHFSNPDGWHHGSHYTCLNDLARIARLALENETIRRYMHLYRDETQYLTGQHVIWENNNLLLHPEAGYYRSDAIGMKTGYTRPAGYCLMSAFAFEEGEIVVGLFGYIDKYARFDDAALLADAAMNQLLLEQIPVESVG